MNFKLFIKSVIFILIALGCKKSKIEKGEFDGTLNGEKWKPRVRISGIQNTPCLILEFGDYVNGAFETLGWASFANGVGDYPIWNGEEILSCDGGPEMTYYYPPDPDVILAIRILDTVRAEQEGAFINIMEIDKKSVKGDMFLPLKRFGSEQGDEFDKHGFPNSVLIEGTFKAYFQER